MKTNKDKTRVTTQREGSRNKKKRKPNSQLCYIFNILIPLQKRNLLIGFIIMRNLEQKRERKKLIKITYLYKITFT